MLLGLGYFGILVFSDDGDVGQRGTGSARELVPILLAVLYLCWSWLWGGHRFALAFTPAEVHHLFPAPVSRRTLLHFKLLRSQLALWFSALFMSALAPQSGLAWWLRIPSMWLLLSTAQLHQIAASLVHANAEAHGARGAKRNAFALSLFALGFGALVWTLVSALPELRGATSVEMVWQRAADALRGPLPSVVLFPFRVLLGPVMAVNSAAWLSAIGPALLLLGLHYFWVMRTDASFEEAAAEIGQSLARRAEAARRGGSAVRVGGAERRAPQRRRLLFPLRPGGHPASALIWKNLVALVRRLRRNTLFMILVTLPILLSALAVSMESSDRAARGVGVAALILGVMIAVMGPFVVRNDLRQDLAHAALLRTFPLRGGVIVGAEIASAAVVLAVAQAVLGAISLAAFAFGGELAGVSAQAPLAIVALAAIVPLNALALAIQNGFVLFYPEWSHIGDHPPDGVEAIGANLMRLTGSVALLAVGLVPPAGAAAIAGGLVAATFGAGAVPAAAVAGVLALWAEVVLVVMWLGEAFERFDPVEAGLRI